ncbi:MAG TPA: hypothetical protein VF533_23790, partial [Solirubrobacteraceae bacterium]
MRRCLVTLMVGLAALCAGAAPAYAEPGDLDPSFSSDGRVAALNAGGFVARAVVVQPDGRIVVGGYSCQPSDRRDGTCRTSGASSFRMLRFTADGGLDPEFGAAGIVTTAVGTGRSQAFDLLLAPDGRLVLAGVARDGGGRDGFALVRYDPSGAVDPSFGEQGVSIVGVGHGFSGIADVEPTAGGGLVAAGVGIDHDGATRFAVARYQGNGALDGGFGSGGSVLAAPAPYASALGTAVSPSGAVVAAGIAGASNAAGDARVGLARLDPAGHPDPGFGAGGTALLGIGWGTSFANAVTGLQDGRALTAGAATDADGKQVMGFLRVTADGRLDSTWDGDGTAMVRVGDGALAADAARDAQGRLVAFGQTASGGADWRFAVTRLSPEGFLDAGFGTGGVAITAFPGTSMARATAGALTPDGRLVAAGVACAGGGHGAQCEGGAPRLALARFQGGGDPRPLQPPPARAPIQLAPWVAVTFPARAPRRPLHIRLRVECLQAVRCAVRLKVRTRGRRRTEWLARGRVRVPAGGARTVTLRLLRTARHLVR